VDVNVDGETFPACEGEPVQVRNYRERRTLAELIDITLGAPDGEGGLNAADARPILARYGLRVEHDNGGDRLWVANRNQTLQRALSGGPWAGGYWRNHLRRLPGATVPDSPQKFAGVLCRFTSLPIALVTGPTLVCRQCDTKNPAQRTACRHCEEPLDGEDAAL
jgi:hypothetical protein